MTQLQRELVSRLTAAVLGAALLYGGWWCIKTGLGFSRGGGLLFLTGGLLLLVGLPLVLFGLLPTRAIERVFRPAAPKTGHDETDGGTGSHWWHIFLWW
jgi:hypothetical protein